MSATRPCRSAYRLHAAALALVVLAGAGAAAAERIAGPVPATVVRVVDGDTIEVAARIWLGLNLTVSARIRGIDTPEVSGKCLFEEAMAAAAAARLADAVADGSVRLRNIENDKYAGRVLADVETAGGVDLAAAMLGSGLARPYDGGERLGWCGFMAAGR